MKHFCDKFYDCKTDKERWELVKNNQHLGMTVYLDNDDTFVKFDDDEDNGVILTFDDYTGNSYGVESLLDAMNIKHAQV